MDSSNYHYKFVLSMKPTNAIAEASRTFELMRVKQLQMLPEDICAGMTSPSLSPSSTSLNLADATASLSLSATGPASPSSGGSSERGAVSLCPESTGIHGLFQRAQVIGRPGDSSNTPRKGVIGAAVTATAAVSAASSEGGGNPLARRGSAVMKHQQQQQQASAPSMDGGSSLMAEVPDEMLSAYNIRPSEDTPLPAPVPSRAAPARADPFSAHRLSPMKPSEKSQSLMADLMGGDATSSGPAAAHAAKQSSVWEDV